MPHTECAHRQAQTQISNENPPSLCSAMHLIRPTGHFLWSKAKHYMRSKGFTFEMQPIQTPVSNLRRGFLLHITISIHSLEFSLGMSTAAHFVFSVLLCPSVRPSLQVSVFQVPVLEGEPLLLSLAPFLVVKVNVSALFKLIGDGLGLLVPLEPHHVLGVKPPGLFLQSLGRQILSLGTLQVIEDEEESFCGQSLVELYGVRVMRWDLMMEGQGGTWIPHQVLPDPLRVRGVGHVRPCRLLHRLLVELVFGERGWTQRTNTERWGDVDLCHGRLRRGRCARCCR